MIICKEFYDELSLLENIKVYKHVSIKNDNNMRVDATFLCKIEIYSFIDAKKTFEIIKKYQYPYYILGNGSNVLFANDNYESILIKIMPINSKNNAIVYAGSLVNFINSKLINENIETLLFLSGVPCSIGGAIFMNAGAFKKEIKDIIEYVYYLDLNELKIKVKDNKECQFSYRDSFFKHNNCLILGAKIKLEYGNKEEILKKHNYYLNIRKTKLPLESPNLGSVFKNPLNGYAGAIIEKMGLKGLSYNGASISSKHANVIINNNNAKGEDVAKLIEIIENLVYMKFNIRLEREIIIFK